MKLFGSIAELVQSVFRTSGDDKQVTILPPSTLTSASNTFTTPSIGAATTDTLLSRTSTDTLTNKTIDADGTGNSISNIENADIKAAANIARTKLASGTANHVLINDGSGVMSSEAQLAATRGGTGVSSTATFPTSGVIVTRTGTDAGANRLQNKDLDDASVQFVNDSDTTMAVKFNITGTTGTTVTLTTAQTANRAVIIPDVSTTLVGQTTLDQGANRLQTKHLDDTTVFFVDSSDTTKQVKIDAAGTTGTATTLLSSQTTNKTLTLPDITDTLVTKTSTDAFQNKSIIHGATGNSITGLVDASISASANITATKLGTGVVDNTEFNRLNTVGTNASGEIVSTDGTQTLSGKTLASAEATTLFRLLNQGQLKLREGTGGGTNEINIQAPATLAADYTLTLPADDGTSGQALTTDGSGVLTWSSVATDALNQFNVKVGDVTNTAAAVNTNSVGDILADSTTGFNIKSGVIVNADVNASAAIAYSKLNLSASIVNADVSASAAIAYSKLNLATSIVNADVAAAAAIAGTKISPNFGSQAVSTTGNMSAAELSLSDSANATQLLQANTAAAFTNNMQELRADRAGTTAYKFIYAKSNFTSSSRDAFTVDGLGNIAAGNTTDAGNKTAEIKAATANDARYYLTTGANTTTIESRGSTSRFDITIPATFSFTTNKASIPTGAVNAVSANYTITDVDGYHTILVTTGAAGKTITLPAPTNNAGRLITIKKVDSGAGTINIAVNGGLIDGASTNGINSQYGFVTLLCDGTNWTVVAVTDYMSTAVSASTNFGTTATWADTSSGTLTLLPGEWELTYALIALRSAATWLEVDMGIGSASGTSTTGLVQGDTLFYAGGSNSTSFSTVEYAELNVPAFKVRVTANTIYYAKVRPFFTAGTPQYSYRFNARRVG